MTKHPPSVLWHSWLSHQRKISHPISPIVSSGTLNSIPNSRRGLDTVADWRHLDRGYGTNCRQRSGGKTHAFIQTIT